jgi:hypothetical protein
MERMSYIESEDKLVIETIYDPTQTLEQNAQERQDRPEHGKYRTSRPAQMIKVASVDMDHIVALKNMGYDLLSADPDEFRRALVYIQSNEPHWLTVDGKPFASWRPKWV